MVRKLREDPLFQIRRQEQAARESMCSPKWDQNGTHWENIPSQYPYGYVRMHGICDTDSMCQPQQVVTWNYLVPFKHVDFLPHWKVNGDGHRKLRSRGWPTLSSWQRSKRSKKKQLSGGPSLCVFDIHRMNFELFRCFTCSCLEKPVGMWGAWQSLNMNWCFKESCKEGKEGCQEGAEGTLVRSAWQHCLCFFAYDNFSVRKQNMIP